MVCLADNANESGASIYPSIDTLVTKSCLSRATVLRLKRKLEDRQLLVMVAPATAYRPIEYRIPVVPRELRVKMAPKRDLQRKGCPPWLRERVLLAFEKICQYCRQVGTATHDANGEWWNIDRLTPGREGGRYEPANVTLSCRRCNIRKRRTWGRPPSLAEVEAQSRTSAVSNLLQSEPFRNLGGSPKETPGGSPAETTGVSLEHSRGLSKRPDPLIDPSSNQRIKSSARAAHDTPADYVKILTLATHVLLREDPTRGGVDLVEDLKTWAAQNIPGCYDSEVIGKAIDSALYQRQPKRKRDTA